MSQNTETWKQASDIYAAISEMPHQQAIDHVNTLENISPKVRSAIITLINASSQASQYFEDEISPNYSFGINNSQNHKVGQVLDEYELLEEIGQGGMSQVFKAKRIHSEQQTFVAIKIFSPKQEAEKLLSHFIKEQKILSKLSHKNIVKMLHSGLTDNQTAYLVMELIENAQPIDAFCKKDKLSNKSKIKLIHQCANALSYSHANLVIHRDLKPDNILIDKQGQLKIVDFGIAKQINKNLDNNTIIALTPKYAAPEQINSEPISIQTDIFSLAVVALDLLTEGNPLPDDRLIKSCENDEAHIDKLLKSQRIDKDLKNILSTALQQKPSMRYVTMNRFAEDLKSWLNDLPVSATGNSFYYQLTKFAKRRKALFASLSTLFITLFFAVFALSWQYHQTTKEKRKAVEIKDFMLNLFSSADPETSLGTKLTALDLLNLANEQIAYKTFSDLDVKAEILTNIGNSLINLGSSDKGEKLLLESISSNPNDINTQLRLAQLYIDSNQLDKATEFLDKLNVKHLEKNSQIELNLLNAMMLKFQGNYKQARTLAEQSIELFKKQKNYLGILKSTRFLTDIIIHNGDTQLAINSIDNAIKQVETHISPVTPELLRLNIRQAALLSIINKHDEAILTIGSTLEKIETKLGEKHPLIILASAEKAGILKFANRLEEAYSEAVRGYDIAVIKYGNNSRLAQNSLYEMADIQFYQKKYQQALEKFETITKVSVINYGEDNFITINSKIGLTDLYFYTNQQDKALRYSENLYKEIIAMFGINNELSIYAINSHLDIVYQTNTVTQQSLQLAEENYNNAKIHLSPNHGQTTYALNVVNKIKTKL